MKNDVSTADIQNKTLNILIAFHQFCEDNNLTYYMIGGTLLGAVRHHGFIPWDDDVDIGMPREDYERFLINAAEFPSPYEIAHPTIDKDYVYPFTKCYDTSTTFTEASKVPFTRGVWIDIFPIDRTYKNKFFRLAHMAAIRTLKSLLAHKTGAYIPTKLGVKGKLKELLINSISLLVSKALILRILDYTLKLNSNSNQNFVGNFLGRWGNREIVRASVLSTRTLLEFEGYYLHAPVDYDKYLRTVYGDYMVPPPESQRSPSHSGLSVDLNLPYKSRAE